MATTIDVARFIDERETGPFQTRILALCMCVLFMDGYDTQVIGYLGPSLAVAFKAPPEALRPVFLVALIGLLIGGLVCGPLADRHGRKTFVVLSTLVFGLLSLATAWAWSIESLIALRFLTGLGLGGAMPNTVALGVEYFPKSKKNFITSSVWVGFSIGAAVAGFAAAGLLKIGDWRTAFMVGGIAPILLAIVLAFALPESLRFLVLRSGGGRVGALLRKVAPEASIPPDAIFVSSEERAAGRPVVDLFRGGRGRGTMVLWTVSFLALAVTFLLTSWLPIAFHQSGMPENESILALAMYQVGAVIGALVIGKLMDRYDKFLILMGAFLCCGVSVLTLSAVSGAVPIPALMALMLFNGIFIASGGTPGVNALTGGYYPTHIRSTGIGWNLGAGRIGSLFGIWLGGAFVAAHFSVNAIFLYVTGSAFVCAALVFVLRAVTPTAEPEAVAAAPLPAE